MYNENQTSILSWKCNQQTPTQMAEHTLCTSEREILRLTTQYKIK